MSFHLRMRGQEYSYVNSRQSFVKGCWMRGTGESVSLLTFPSCPELGKFLWPEKVLKQRTQMLQLKHPVEYTGQ
jgi:hypothetical protein